MVKLSHLVPGGYGWSWPLADIPAPEFYSHLPINCLAPPDKSLLRIFLPNYIVTAIVRRAFTVPFLSITPPNVP